MGLYTNTVTATWADLATTLAALTVNTSVVISDPPDVVFNAVNVSGSFGYIIKNSCPSTVLVDFSDNDFSANTNVTEIASGSYGWFTGCATLGGMGKQPSSLTDGHCMFQGCTSLAGVDLSNLTALTSGYYMFRGCTSLTGVDLSNLTALTDGDCMFHGCTSLTGVDLSNLTALTAGHGMFHGCTSLTGVDLSKNTALTSGYDMFYGCTSLTGVDLSNLTALTDGNGMFFGCTSLAGVDLSNLTALTSGYHMFQGCTSLAGVDLSNLTALTSGSNMFFGCTSLAGVDLSNLTALTDGDCMFQGCTSLAGVDLSDLTALTDGRVMFSGCTSLAGVDLSKNTALTRGHNMFSGCTSLAGVDLSKNTALTNAYLMLSGCTALKKAFLHKYLFTLSGTNTALTLTDCSALTDIWIDDASVTTTTLQGYGLPTTAAPTITYYLRCAFSELATKFAALTANTSTTPYHLWIDSLTADSLGASATSGTLGYILNNSNTNSVYYLFDSEHTDFGVASVTSYAGLLKDCVKMTKFLNTSLNTACTSLSHAFDGCTAMTDFARSMPSSMTLLTDVSYMLNGCTALPSCTVSLPNSVTNMNSAFKGTLVSDTLVGGVASFPAGVTDISYCFYGDTAQDLVYDIPSTVSAMDYAYKGCTGVVAIKPIPEGCSASYAFDGCTGITAVSCLQNTPSSLAYAFNGCTSLTSVTSFSVDTLSCTMTGCFTGCTALTEIDMPIKVDAVTDSDTWKYVVIDDEAGTFTVDIYSRNLLNGATVLSGSVTAMKKSDCDYIIMYGKLDELLFNTDTALDAGTILTMIKYGYPFNDTYGEGTDPSKKTFILQAADSAMVKSNAFITVAQTIGSIYVQFPNQSTPYSLFGGTWTDISSDYAGAFFRANGGNSAAFGTLQAQSIESHTHTFSYRGTYGTNGWPNGSADSGAGGGNQGYWRDGASMIGSTTGSTGSTETKPINYSVIIWKRTA